MADVKDNLTHLREEKDNLMQYLMSDIVRMLLLENPHLDLQRVTMDMLSKSAQELINMHASASREIETKYIIDADVKKFK